MLQSNLKCLRRGVQVIEVEREIKQKKNSYHVARRATTMTDKDYKVLLGHHSLKNKKYFKVIH